MVVSRRRGAFHALPGRLGPSSSPGFPLRHTGMLAWWILGSVAAGLPLFLFLYSRYVAEVTRREVVHLLETYPGPKHLLVEQCLIRPLDKVASMSILKAHGCLSVFTISPDGSLPPAVFDVGGGGKRPTRVFLMRSSIPNARRLAGYLRADEETPAVVIWVDRRLAVADRELERAGVYGNVEQTSLALPLLPLETDLFSLELPQWRRVDYLSVSTALYQLQSLYGQFPFVYGVGEAASNTWKMLKVLYADRGEPRALADQPISHLFLLDRNLDPASVLMTGTTYESMLHDVYRIRCGKVSFGKEVEEKLNRISGGGDKEETAGAGKRSTIVTLDNNDGIFASVRNMHMTAAFPWLSAKVKEVQASYNKGSAMDATIADVKAFVTSELATLRSNHRQLGQHICACEVLIERTGSAQASDRLALEHALVAGEADLNEVLTFLEDAMLAEASPWQVLSLACLACIASVGLPAKIHSAFREAFLHAYGYESLPVLHTLASRRLLWAKASPLGKFTAGGGGAEGRGGKAGQLLSALPSALPLGKDKGGGNALLGDHGSPSHSGTPSLPYMIKRMGLVPSPAQGVVNVRQPDRMSYVFSGAFAPPLCTLIADTMARGWQTSEVERTFGKAFAETNTMTPAERKPDSRMRKAIMAFFVGGVTYAEVAALRWLAAANNFRILIGATHIIHREDWLQSMGEADGILFYLQKPRLYVKVGTKFAEKLRKHVKCIDEVYTPTWWCPFGNMQTVVRQLFRSCPTLPWEREIMEYDDGGISGLDWLHPKDKATRDDPDTPVVLFLPGITGSTHEASYLLHAAIEANERGWRCVVSNARGLGGVQLRTPKTYSACYGDDLREIIKMLNARYPKATKLGCGFSLGGMILYNYLAKCADAEEAGITASMIVSSPWNSMVSTFAIEKFWPRVLFNSHIRTALINLVLPYKEMFEELVDWNKMLAAQTIRDFDKAFVVPLFGFPNFEAYYHESALYYKVDRIPIPLLSVTAADDCFAHPDTLPIADVCRSENVAICLTQHGGHTAFMQDANPNNPGFIEKAFAEYGSMIFNEA